jgi:hypothetical protein
VFAGSKRYIRLACLLTAAVGVLSLFPTGVFFLILLGLGMSPLVGVALLTPALTAVVGFFLTVRDIERTPNSGNLGWPLLGGIGGLICLAEALLWKDTIMPIG